MLVFSKPIIIPYENTILSPQQDYEVCKRPSPKEQTDSSELTQAMPARNRKYFFVILCRITRILLIFYLLLCTFWKEIIKYFLQGGKILACSLQMWKAKQGEMKWTACDHPSAKQGQIKVFWWSPKWAVSTLQLVVGLRVPLSRWGLLARMCYSFWYSCTNISSVQWKAKCR